MNDGSTFSRSITAGAIAFFVELTFPSGGRYPFKETTAVRVIPDTLPYPPPTPMHNSAAARGGM